MVSVSTQCLMRQRLLVSTSVFHVSKASGHLLYLFYVVDLILDERIVRSSGAAGLVDVD